MHLDLPKVLAEVPGWLTSEEALLLYSLARDWPGSGRIVEVGSFQGRSTICLAAGLLDRQDDTSSMLSVDTHLGSVEHQPGESAFHPNTLNRANGRIDTLALLMSNLRRFSVASRVEVSVSTSIEAARIHTGKIRLLFIDADHSEDAVMSDVVEWGRHLDSTACLVLHDVGAWRGPTVVALHLLKTGKWEVIKRSESALALRIRATAKVSEAAV